MTLENEIEVYRLVPVVGKYYQTAESTRREYAYNNQSVLITTHFTKNPLKYVGKYVRTERFGYGDGSYGFAVFDNNGREIIVHYSYEGNTCFIEVPAPQ
jgi:hypothetical protein